MFILWAKSSYLLSLFIHLQANLPVDKCLNRSVDKIFYAKQKNYYIKLRVLKYSFFQVVETDMPFK